MDSGTLYFGFKSNFRRINCSAFIIKLRLTEKFAIRKTKSQNICINLTRNINNGKLYILKFFVAFVQVKNNFFFIRKPDKNSLDL